MNNPHYSDDKITGRCNTDPHREPLNHLDMFTSLLFFWPRFLWSHFIDPVQKAAWGHLLSTLWWGWWTVLLWLHPCVWVVPHVVFGLPSGLLAMLAIRTSRSDLLMWLWVSIAYWTVQPTGAHTVARHTDVSAVFVDVFQWQQQEFSSEINGKLFIFLIQLSQAWD